MKKRKLSVLLFLFLRLQAGAVQEVYSTSNGTATFRSEAAQELISGTSNHLRGLLDIDKRTFAFRILIRSFQGFNSGLQREHFNENYLESEKFPEATFRGKIIEQVDFTQNGKFSVRAKGILSIHGVEQERIIKSELTVQNGMIHLDSKFTVLITDHDIKVPRVVHEKIASEIMVEVIADFKRRAE
jgi:polyisoprenoid-binding protein YceI